MGEGILHLVKLVLLHLGPPANSIFLGQAYYHPNTSLLAVWASGKKYASFILKLYL